MVSGSAEQSYDRLVAGPRLRLCVLAVGLLATGCGSARRAASPLTPRAYLDRALQLMQSDAVYTPGQGWPSVVAEATRIAASAETPADTYTAIEYAILQLQRAGDLHAEFSNPFAARLERQAASSPRHTPPPTVSLAASRIGLIRLPGIATSPTTADARHYETVTLRGIARLQHSKHPCGWIIDLRGDPGGNMWPMLLSVGPILGNGRLIGFTRKHQPPLWVSYHDGTLSGAGYTARAPDPISNLKPAPAVAVITGPETHSAGEAVAIAFRGRPHSRSFGTRTGGATNSPTLYPLADHATIRFSTNWDIDRRGHIYRHPIQPDTPVAAPGGQDNAARTAAAWLTATTTCTTRP